MTVSYDTLLRDNLGEPTVSDRLWRAVTSVEAGDERAYGEALLTIDRMSWRDFEDRYYESVSSRWAGRMVGDYHLPGGALETLFSARRVHNKFRAALAAHQNVTETLARDAARSRSVLVREALAGNPSIGSEAVSVLRQSKSQEVIGRLLSNGAIDGEALRGLVEYARRIGMTEYVIASDGCENMSMPVDVVLEWAAGDAELRPCVLSSPVLPRGKLVQLLLEGVDGSVDQAARFAFESQSNADGALIDWYVNAWFRRAGSSSRSLYRTGVACALSHPRAWGSTLERAYVLCGDGKYGNEIVENILCSPSCPDWARRDVLARGDERLIRVAATWCSNVPPSFVRALSDKGCWRVAAACLSAPSDVLVEAVEPLVAWAKDKRLRRIVLSDVITHGNFPPEVRREVAPWLKASLWAVARDGFLGRS